MLHFTLPYLLTGTCRACGFTSRAIPDCSLVTSPSTDLESEAEVPGARCEGASSTPDFLCGLHSWCAATFEKSNPPLM